MRLAVCGKRFDGSHRVADGIQGERHATVDWYSVEQYGAARTCAAVADDLRADEAHLNAQSFCQRGAGFDLNSMFLAVYVQLDWNRAGAKLSDAVCRFFSLMCEGMDSFKQSRSGGGNAGALEEAAAGDTAFGGIICSWSL